MRVRKSSNTTAAELNFDSSLLVIAKRMGGQAAMVSDDVTKLCLNTLTLASSLTKYSIGFVLKIAGSIDICALRQGSFTVNRKLKEMSVGFPLGFSVVTVTSYIPAATIESEKIVNV